MLVSARFICKSSPFSITKLLTLSLCFGALFLCLISFDLRGAIPGNCTSYRYVNISDTVKCDGGNLFGLFFVFICASLGGDLISVLRLPPLLGMLIMGFILRNVPYINIAVYIDNLWSGYLRKLALLVILIRAGLGLNPQSLKKLSFVVFRLAFGPCLVEAIVTCVMTHFVLTLPWGWSFIVGFVLSAVSPAVVIPSILELEKQGLGIDQGVNTLVIAAASIDDVLAITGFGIALSFTFTSTDNVIFNIFRGPIEAIIGVVFGITFGVILWILPTVDSDKIMFYRTTIMLLLSASAMFGSATFHIPGAGPLAVLTLAFVASIRWRQQISWCDGKNPISNSTTILWWILQPFLFGLIGAGLEIHSISFRTFGFGILILVVGLCFRLITSFIVVFGSSFNAKEKLFVSLAWLPKATVQAAIGPLALDIAIKNGSEKEFIKYGEMVLAISFISIIITAPLGALLISMTAPSLLQSSAKSNQILMICDEEALNFEECNELRSKDKLNTENVISAC